MPAEYSIDLIIREIVQINFRELIDRATAIRPDSSNNFQKTRHVDRNLIFDKLCSLYQQLLTQDEIIFLYDYLCTEEGKSINNAHIEIAKQLPGLLSGELMESDA